MPDNKQKTKIYKDKKEFDKANQAYKDSLALYNMGKWSYDQFKDITKRNKITSQEAEEYSNFYQKLREKTGEGFVEPNERLFKLNKKMPKGVFFSSDAIKDENSATHYLSGEKFKKPTQKPIYQPDTKDEQVKITKVPRANLEDKPKLEPLQRITGINWLPPVGELNSKQLPVPEIPSTKGVIQNYTAAKQLEKMKKPTGYVNQGDKQGIQEFQNGGQLGSTIGSLAGMGLGSMIGIPPPIASMLGGKAGNFVQNQFSHGGKPQFNQSNMNNKLTHYKGDPNIIDGISVGSDVKVNNDETNWNGFVNSDSPEIASILKPILKGKTPAQASKEIEKKYAKRSKAGDKITLESEKREQNYIKGLGEKALAVLQEHTGMTNQGNKMWSGGWMKNINSLANQANDFSNYTQPGPLASTTSFNNILTTEDKNNVLDSGKIRTNMGVVDGTTINPKDEGSIIDSSFTGRLNLNNGIMGVNKPKNYKQPGAFNLNTPNLDAKDGNLAASKFIGETKGENNYNPTPSDGTKPLQTEVNPLGFIASNVGPAFDILQGLKGGDEVNFDRIKQVYANANPAIAAMNSATSTSFNNARNAMRNNATSSGEYLAMMNNLAGSESLKRGLGRAQIKSEYDKINSGTANQIASQNAGIQMNEANARQQEVDASRSAVSQGLHNFGQNSLGFGQDIAMNKSQNTMLPMLSDTYEYFVDADGKVGTRRKKGLGNSKDVIQPFV